MQANNEQPDPSEESLQRQTQLNSYDWIIQPDSSQKIYGLALGNLNFASSEQELQKLGIGAVLTVMGEAELRVGKDLKHLRILIADDPSENIKCFFDSAGKFITENLKKHNVLVHCKAGVSRSATVVASYLMSSRSITAAEAIEQLRAKRPIVFPNKGFQKQLRAYERELAERRAKSNCQLI